MNILPDFDRKMRSGLCWIWTRFDIGKNNRITLIKEKSGDGTDNSVSQTPAKEKHRIQLLFFAFIVLVLIITQHVILIETVKLLVIVDMAVQINYVRDKESKTVTTKHVLRTDNSVSQTPAKENKQD